MSGPGDIDAKRRASFGRADRLKKEAAREAQRAVDREKADQQRKAEAIKAVELRNAQARKRAEQRRMEGHKDNTRKQFTSASDERAAKQARVEQLQKADALKVAAQKQNEERRLEAEAFVKERHKQQLADQQAEHRRQTDRLRAEHQAWIHGQAARTNGVLAQHAGDIRNIDLAERRDFAALNERRHSLAGRAVGLVRGAGHFDRLEQAITDRHEADRWRKHSDLEAKKERLFWSEQSARLRHASERMTIMKQHSDDRRERIHALEKSRPHQVEVQIQALARVNDNVQSKTLQNVRSHDASHASGRSHELKR